MSKYVTPFLLLIILSTNLITAKNCQHILQEATQLTANNQWQTCANLLQESACTQYEHYNLLLNAYIHLEDYARVRQLSEHLLRQNTDSLTQALAHHYRAIALFKQKQYEAAYQQAQQATALWPNAQSAEYAMTQNAMGNILEAQDKHNEAIESYKKAYVILGQLPADSLLYKWQISTLANLSNAYMSKNSHLAIKPLQQALQIFQQHPQSTQTEYVALLNNMGQYYNQKAEYATAATYYQQAIEIKKEHALINNQSYAVSLLNVITALYNAEKYTETIPYIQEYVQLLRQMLQRNFAVMPQKEREAYWNAQAHILDNLLVSATYAALSDKQADASLLYDICLLSKSLLLDTSIHMDHLINASSNSHIRQNRQLLIETQQKLQLLGENNTPYAKALSVTCDSLEQVLLQDMSQLQTQMKQLHITWKDIRAKLTKQDLVVEFVCLGSNNNTEYAVILLKHDWKFPKVYYLNGLAETLAAKQITRMQMHNNAIFGKLVWQEILKVAKPNDHIYFVPAGELQLMSAEYFTINDDVKMYDRYQMHRLSSSKQLLRPALTNSWKTVALVGGMDYNANIDEIAYYANTYNYTPYINAANTEKPTFQIWTPLPGALREVEEINNLLTERHIKPFLATHDAATTGAIYFIAQQGYDIVHIATHGYYGHSDQQAGLAMAGANTLQLNPNSSYGTGILTAQELAKLNLQKTQLAVLSACQTGVGEITIEGVSGLQRAFKRAGVRSLLVSLWEVNDAVTATLMTTFYKALMAGYPFNEAFVIAIDTVRQSTFTINGVKTSGDDISLYGAFVLID